MGRKFVSWRRVSTKKQEKSGLGLEAQSSVIDYFVKAEQGELIADFVETYTGKDLRGCTELRKAMAYCKEHDAILIIAKCDRFRCTKEALEIYNEMEPNIFFCDLPNSDKFSLTLNFALAEREALFVSIRTKAALAVKKAQGYKLGRKKGVDLSKANEASVKAKKERARTNPNNIAIWGIIGYSGLPTCEELAQMSATLNRQNIKTAKGLEFTPERVRTAYHNMKKYMLNN